MLILKLLWFSSHIEQRPNSFLRILSLCKVCVIACNQYDMNFAKKNQYFVGKVFEYGISFKFKRETNRPTVARLERGTIADG